MSNQDVSRKPPVSVLLEEPLLLEEREDAADIVTSLSPQAFVRVLRRLDEDGRADLALLHATGEQLTGLMDLDCWVRDRVDVGRARRWLSSLARTYKRAGVPRGALVRTIDAMDPEMWTLALHPGLVVCEIDPEDDESRDHAHDRLAGMAALETPDGGFVVGASDDEAGHRALEVIAAVYADSLRDGAALVRSIEALIAPETEEDLLRFRNGRLADLGFVDFEEAMRLFRPLDRDAALEREPTDFKFLDDAPQDELTTFEPTGLLQRVLARLEDSEHGLRSREFLLLVNEVSAAQRLSPGDGDDSQRAINQTQATISLGLEMLAAAVPDHPDPEALLAERLRAIGLRNIFRVGYGALDKLRKAALGLHERGRVSLTHPGSLLDRPHGPTLAALARAYPELPVPTSSKKTRPLRSLADVAHATAVLAQAGAIATLAFSREGFAIDPTWIPRVDAPESLTLGDLIRTTLIHRHLEGTSGKPMAPLTPGDLAFAAKHLVPGGKLRPDVRASFEDTCERAGAGAHTQALASALLPRLEVELAALETTEEGAVDLTKVGGLLTIQSVSMWLKTRTG